ncbi:unnamed protein product [Adineta ricciae]|uniref:G-protein coupled receptors family 1 profile domain-containing protein n=1 Tax=Adineta ricciae TaxID=249248 RepID=A0A815YN12_ADIRI|nr:unnamed protein product [Adineta ricciae]
MAPNYLKFENIDNYPTLSDLLFNIALSVRGISDLIEGESERVCMFITFFSHLAELLSAYYTVLFTIQRYCAVRYPFEVAINRRSASIIPLSIIFLLSSLFCFFFHYEENPSEKCRPVPALHWFIANALLSFVIPFSLISIFNILIVYYIRKYSLSPIGVENISLKKKNLLKTRMKTSSLDDTGYNPEETRIPSLGSSFDGIICSTSPDCDRLCQFISLRETPTRNTYYSSDSYSKQIPNKSSAPSKENEPVDRLTSRMAQSIRVTRMLVFVSTCFLILNAPAHLCAIAMKIHIEVNSFIPAGSTVINLNQIDNNVVLIPHTSNETYHENLFEAIKRSSFVDDKSTYQQLYKAVSITQMIQYASYSINFFLYSFSGITFRTSLKQVIQKL